MSDGEGGYELVLSWSGLFKTIEEEHAFTHGFAFSQLWSRMSDGNEAEIEETTRVENRAVIARAAAAKGWELEVKPSDTTGWDFTKLVKVRAEKPNPHGLRVVR